ncbi:MAG: hypothetical protein R3F55_12245 [Alphaproteobacteria bacterium]
MASIGSTALGIAGLGFALTMAGCQAARGPSDGTGRQAGATAAVATGVPPATPASCTADLGAPAEIGDGGLQLVERLRGETPGSEPFVTAALLAGARAAAAGTWERAYAFCALVPDSAAYDQTKEAGLCRARAALALDDAHLPCALALAGQWAAEQGRIGLGLATPAAAEEPPAS